MSIRKVRKRTAGERVVSQKLVQLCGRILELANLENGDRTSLMCIERMFPASVLKAPCLWLLICVYWDISVQSDPDMGYGMRAGFEGCWESPRCRHSGELRTLKSPKRTLWELLVNSSGIISYGTLGHVFWNMGWRGLQGLQAIGKQTPETVLGE